MCKQIVTLICLCVLVFRVSAEVFMNDLLDLQTFGLMNNSSDSHKYCDQSCLNLVFFWFWRFVLYVIIFVVHGHIFAKPSFIVTRHVTCFFNVYLSLVSYMYCVQCSSLVLSQLVLFVWRLSCISWKKYTMKSYEHFLERVVVGLLQNTGVKLTQFLCSAHYRCDGIGW